jgi:hypothetical protein
MERSSVEVIPLNGKFVVRIIENGETRERSFDFELHAQSFADGQRYRLLSAYQLPLSEERS